MEAREECRVDGIEPVANYEVGSKGMEDLSDHKVWAEFHKPNYMQLSFRLLSPRSHQDLWKRLGIRMTIWIP